MVSFPSYRGSLFPYGYGEAGVRGRARQGVGLVVVRPAAKNQILSFRMGPPNVAS